MNDKEEKFKIRNMTNGEVDFEINYKDTAMAVVQACIKEKCLCIGFSLILYDPDETVPQHERFPLAFYIPDSKSIPEEFRINAKKSMKYIAEQVVSIWKGESIIPPEVKH